MPNLGKLIVFEGGDGAGKSTQFERLCTRLCEEGRVHQRLRFPRYDKESSALIRMYLRGDFGTKPSEVNAYAASAFYAVDRYAAYKQDWQQDYESGALFLADRYTTSNAVHQSAKLPKSEREDYIRWLSDFEYVRMGLPRPDLVLYLDLPTEAALLRIKARAGEDARDIHEQDASYLADCREAAMLVAQQEGWTVIPCLNEQGEMYGIEQLHEIIYATVLPFLERSNG